MTTDKAILIKVLFQGMAYIFANLLIMQNVYLMVQ